MPARASILNIWRYYDEVFEFHNGRLLLRGPNGTGKSTAPELLLPYLFDASLRANRLSTFGTGERTMQAVHERLSSGRSVRQSRIGPLDSEQRTAIAELLNLDRLPPPRPTIGLAELDEIPHETAASTPVRRSSSCSARSATAPLIGHRPQRGEPTLGSGCPVGLSCPASPLTVLEQLPATGEPLPSFAEHATGDPQALDDGTRLAGLVPCARWPRWSAPRRRPAPRTVGTRGRRRRRAVHGGAHRRAPSRWRAGSPAPVPRMARRLPSPALSCVRCGRWNCLSRAGP